jgi:hypothetical protein
MTVRAMVPILRDDEEYLLHQLFQEILEGSALLRRNTAYREKEDGEKRRLQLV